MSAINVSPALTCRTGIALAVVPELVERIGAELQAEHIGVLRYDRIAQAIARMVEPDFGDRQRGPLDPAHRKRAGVPKPQPRVDPVDRFAAAPEARPPHFLPAPEGRNSFEIMSRRLPR